AQGAQGLAHETHVEQVQDRVLDPPGVLMHRQPLAAQILVHERGGELWVQVAIHVPGRVDECVHRVNVPARGATAFRTRGVDEGRDVRQRRASATARRPSAVGVPLNGPLRTMRPSPKYGAPSEPCSMPSGEITSRISRPCRLAKSKSRSSWPGTAMIAPVPYV